MSTRMPCLVLTLLLPVADIGADSLVIDSRRQWEQWQFPQGVIDLHEDGSVGLIRFDRNIDAVADARNFTHKNAAGDEVRGGISKAGSNPADAANILDADPETWWQPDPAADVDSWRIEIDLGRLVQASTIRLHFPDNDEAVPLREFTVLASEGTRQAIGRDLFLFSRVGGTTLPNEETLIEIQLSTVEPGNATGDHLVTTTDDTLSHMPVQYVRIVSQTKNPGGALADVEVIALGDNIGLGTIERGGTLRGGSNTQNITNLADGSASLWWSGRGRPIPWRESGMWFEWDLGATFWVDRLAMLEPSYAYATTGSQNSQQISFEWQTSDGTPVPTEGDVTIQSPFDFQYLTFIDNRETSGAGRNRHYDLRFPPRKVRYLFYNHEAFDQFFTYHLFEVFLYGRGFPAKVRARSGLIDLQGAKSLRSIRWEAMTPPGTGIEIRSRTGDSIVEEILYFGKNGEAISEALWNKLPASQKLPLVVNPEAGPGWSAWSSVYKVQGESFLSPSPRAFVQLDVSLTSDDPDLAPLLRSIAIDFDAPLVGGGVFARVLPPETSLDSLTEFSMKLGGRPEPGDRGFDQIGLFLPEPIEGPVELRLRDRLVEPLRVDESMENELLVTLPEVVLRDSVELILPMRLASSTTLFDAWVSSSSEADVRQSIQPSELGAMTVYVPEIAAGGALIRNLKMTTGVLTPNGDGVNDRLSVELLVVKTGRVPQLLIFDLSGRQVAELSVSGDGEYEWDGRGPSGNLLPPGAYLLVAEVVADALTDRRQRVISLAY